MLRETVQVALALGLGKLENLVPSGLLAGMLSMLGWESRPQIRALSPCCLETAQRVPT